MRPSEWRPIRVEDLEPQALEVVRSTTHCSVIAGPGSGKTELLAQRACYLLQTGLCPSPRRILAISFKKDAAKNLKDRVAQRCRREDALRFDSLTFDAFSKGLLDRFFQALPEIWRPTGNYEIYFPTEGSKSTVSEFFETLIQLEVAAVTKTALRVFPQSSFMKTCVLGAPLRSEGLETTDIGSRAARRWWEDDLRGRTPSRLSRLKFVAVALGDKPSGQVGPARVRL
jgi:UvrD/REP helicase N-terminal domain